MAEKLTELGFTNFVDLGTKNGQTLFRIMTRKGWAYERFSTVDDVEQWAKGRAP